MLSGKDRSLADLLHAKEFAELDMDANIVAWSKVRFLMETGPDRFRGVPGAREGQLDAWGVPNGRTWRTCGATGCGSSSAGRRRAGRLLARLGQALSHGHGPRRQPLAPPLAPAP
ncbi:MAG: hypothetical protein IPK67_14340 [Planctomycetes bacterium]|nr:hypothetical protein [Planctomycetota bacterium]